MEKELAQNQNNDIKAEETQECACVKEDGVAVEADKDVESAEVTLDSSDTKTSESDQETETDDSLTFSHDVIEKIVAIATRKVDGVLGMKGGWYDRFTETFGAKDPGKGVSIEVMSDSRVKVDVAIIIKYGTFAPDIFESVRDAIITEIMSITGLNVSGVNVRIEDILTQDEYEAKKRAQMQMKHEETSVDA